MHLAIYIGQHCDNCQEALAIAEAVRGASGITVQVIDWDDPLQEVPSRVVAVPTYLLDDRIVSLGNPDRQAFLAMLHDQERSQEQRR